MLTAELKPSVICCCVVCWPFVCFVLCVWCVGVIYRLVAQVRGERDAQHIDIVFLLVSYVIVTTTLIHLTSICSEEFDGKVYDMIVYGHTIHSR